MAPSLPAAPPDVRALMPPTDAKGPLRGLWVVEGVTSSPEQEPRKEAGDADAIPAKPRKRKALHEVQKNLNRQQAGCQGRDKANPYQLHVIQRDVLSALVEIVHRRGGKRRQRQQKGK